MTVETRLAANPSEVDAAIRLAAQTFQPDTGVERKRQFVFGDSEPPPADVVVAMDGQSIVGTILLVDRTIRRGGDEISVTYLSSICIAQEMRGKGYSRPLMEIAMEASRARGSSIALLVARRAVDHYYPRFGFHGISSHSQIDLQCSSLATSDTLPVLRAATANDLDACASIYDYSYGKVFGHNQRDAQFWRLALRKLQLLGVTFLVAFRDNRQVGYIIASEARVYEIGTPPSLEASAVLAAYAGAFSFDHLTLDVPPSHAAVPQVERFGTFRSRECRFGGHMGAVISASSLQNLAAGRVARRAAQLKISSFHEQVDGIDYTWDGTQASVQAPTTLDFAKTARLIGASQLSLNSQPVLDPGEPFNFLFVDQI